MGVTCRELLYFIEYLAMYMTYIFLSYMAYIHGIYMAYVHGSTCGVLLGCTFGSVLYEVYVKDLVGHLGDLGVLLFAGKNVICNADRNANNSIMRIQAILSLIS